MLTTYGKVNPSFIMDMAERTHLTSSTTFLDLGSGIGQTMLQVAATLNCECVGIELGANLHESAELLLKKFDALLEAIGCEGRISHKISLIKGNMCDYGGMIEDADVVFFNNFGSRFIGDTENILSNHVSVYICL